MATIFASPSISISCCSKPFNPHKNPTTLLPSSMPIRLGLTHTITIPNSYSNSFISNKKSSNFNKIRSVAEEEPVTEEDTITNQGEVEPTVSVPVSPSDILTMFFQVFISSIPLVFVCKNYVFIDRLMNACQLFDFGSIFKEQKKHIFYGSLKLSNKSLSYCVLKFNCNWTHSNECVSCNSILLFKILNS